MKFAVQQFFALSESAVCNAFAQRDSFGSSQFTDSDHLEAFGIKRRYDHIYCICSGTVDIMHEDHISILGSHDRVVSALRVSGFPVQCIHRPEDHGKPHIGLGGGIIGAVGWTYQGSSMSRDSCYAAVGGTYLVLYT